MTEITLTELAHTLPELAHTNPALQLIQEMDAYRFNYVSTSGVKGFDIDDHGSIDMIDLVTDFMIAQFPKLARPSSNQYEWNTAENICRDLFFELNNSACGVKLTEGMAEEMLLTWEEGINTLLKLQ